VVDVQGVKDVVQVSAGYDHSCALTKDGRVHCWGRNNHGQVTGDGNPSDGRMAVTQLAELAHVVQVSAGTEHSCALLADGTVRCWGDDSFGQVSGHAVSSSSMPVTIIADLSDVDQVIAARAHTCVLVRDGSVRCWGMDGVSTNAALHTIDGISGAIRLAEGASASQTCVLMNDHSINCWGQNTLGETTGDGAATDNAPVAAVMGLSNVKQVATGEGHSCALLEDDSVRCWGDDNYAQATGHGNGTGVPAAVSTIPGL
jgi:alpha-tubulin suppressor-like RCC1 family protein